MSFPKLAITLLFCCLCHLSTGQEEDSLILEIRTEFNRINALPVGQMLEVIRLENEEFMDQMTDGGGSLTGYFEEGKLIKITESIGLSWGMRETDYYLKEEMLFFAFQVERQFKQKLDEEGIFLEFDFSAEPIAAYEGRYYFQNSRTIRQLDKGERTFARAFVLNDFIERAITLIDRLQTKKKKR